LLEARAIAAARGCDREVVLVDQALADVNDVGPRE
jgi:hypothetical protein